MGPEIQPMLYLPDFPGGSDGKVSVYNVETWVRSLGLEDLLEKEMAIHSSTIAWKSHGQKSLVGYSPWGRKESDTTERLHFPFKILRLKTLGFPGSTKKQTNKQTKKTCL